MTHWLITWLLASPGAWASEEATPPPGSVDETVDEVADEVAEEPLVLDLDEAEDAETVPVLGLADLHLHQWAELAYASRWYHGDGAGPHTTSLSECGDVMDRPKIPKRIEHGVVSRVWIIPDWAERPLAKWGMQDERSDDVRPKHPPGGYSSAGSLPHWLGWPTADSLAHQQVWDGWLRLAHDGVPFLWYLDQNDHDGDVRVALDRFYDHYPEHMTAAAREGAVGLNLVVVSLVHNNIMCRQQVDKKALRANPAICNDMDAVKRQYDAAVHWAGEHGDWVRIVTTPWEAEDAIRSGKLAMVLSIEAADLFGASETIGEASRFRRGYYGRAMELIAQGQGREPAVRQALAEYLDALPLVSTIQLTHQYDSSFAGAAFLANTFVKQQKWKDRNPGSIRVDDPKTPEEDLQRHDCREQAEAWKWEGEASYYPLCQAELSTEVNSSPSSSGFLRLWQNTWPGRHSVPAAYARQARERGGQGPYENPYGLSVDGRILADLLVDRGMVIDTTHLSRRAAAELSTRHPDVPLYTSHTYPHAINLLEREQNPVDAQLGRLDVAGVRPGDDEVNVRNAADDSPFAGVLGRYDCYGTSVAAGLYLETVQRAGPVPAYGTDLNGFINQPAASMTLRPEVWGGSPCALGVPSIGSEVAQRGLAHIGLLPQLHMEATAAVGGLEHSDALQEGLDGAPAFIATWRRAACGGQRPPSECGEAAPRTDDVEPWGGWGDWVYADDGTLEEVVVPLPETRAPAPLVASSAARPSTTMPRWRAIEGTLPYFAHEVGEAVDQPIIAQLPTRLGFLVGAYAYRASWERYHFPVGRCRYSGWNKMRTWGAGERKEKRLHCRELQEARKRYMSSRRKQTKTHRMLGAWDRIYPGPLAGKHEQSLERRLTLLHEGPVERSAWRDMPGHELTVDLLLADGGRCLAAKGLLDAPPVGLPAGRAPRDWIEERPRGLAVNCYCDLLAAADGDGIAIDRDREGLRACEDDGRWPH